MRRQDRYDNRVNNKVVEFFIVKNLGAVILKPTVVHNCPSENLSSTDLIQYFETLTEISPQVLVL